MKNLATVSIFTMATIAAAAAAPPPLQSVDPSDCSAVIRVAEQAGKLPGQLLQAIAMAESGRVHPVTNRVAPWPWTINVAGTGYFYNSKQEAIAAVETFRAQRIQSMDVGCMQINLMHHPAAFRSLDEAFEPQTNVAYGSRFLTGLFQQFRNWPQAVAAYHSQTPALGAAYVTRVFARWPGASRYSDGMSLVTQAVVARPKPNPNHTPEFAKRLREVEEDRRTLLGSGIATERVARSAPASRGNLRLAQLN